MYIIKYNLSKKISKILAKHTQYHPKCLKKIFFKENSQNIAFKRLERIYKTPPTR